MHLSVQWVENLEKDDYSQAPALIYVRGYLRAYARCVGLRSEKIMTAFDALALNEEFEQIKVQEEKSVKHQSVPVISHSSRMISRKMTRWITFLILAILIVSVGIWWQEKKRSMEQIQFVVAPTGVTFERNDS
ncbi:helix-turn-helix domain-containing protein [Coxiella endosymbiont of Dermacentor marginatus]|uniref:helix-turn-helix domain-containing protein n=1 Tax=Coxiella endosymbiont of Dermacentor marginatus TaxID=1656159 RepID=UPI0038734B53